MSLSSNLQMLGEAASAAARLLGACTTAQKNQALFLIADQILKDQHSILQANEADVASALSTGLSPVMIERLKLTLEGIESIAASIREAAQLPEPIGKVLKKWNHTNGLEFQKISVPMGVIGIIYESRPNVTADAAILCLKAGNACILRGGSEAFYSNQAIARSLERGLENSDIPPTAIQLIQTTDREAVRLLCEMDRYVNCLIPRGGKGLIETVMRYARMPVIKHYDGVCAAYIDQEANLQMAEQIVLNAKCQRPSACNSIETLLLHESIVLPFLETSGKKLLQAGVILRCDQAIKEIIPAELNSHFKEQIEDAREEDFHTEFLSLIVAIKVVPSLEAAIAHIEAHGSHHSDLIITENEKSAEIFLQAVDSATVYWNASTRFTDGHEFGFGAEIGISTDRLHARGPVGLEELTSYKYVIRGNGQVRI